MWRPYTNNFKFRHGLTLAATLLMVGCSSMPKMLEGPGAWNTADQIPPSARVAREYDAAVELMESDHNEEAMQRLEVFIVENPQWPGAYVNLAILYDHFERYDDAVNTLSQAISVAPDFLPAYNHMGVIKRRHGDFVGAEQAWQQALQVDQAYSYAWYNLGVLYELYMQDLGKALDHFRRYQEVTDPEEADPKVVSWITDLERRIGAPGQSAANLEAP